MLIVLGGHVLTSRRFGVQFLCGRDIPSCCGRLDLYVVRFRHFPGEHGIKFVHGMLGRELLRCGGAVCGDGPMRLGPILGVGRLDVFAV